MRNKKQMGPLVLSLFVVVVVATSILFVISRGGSDVGNGQTVKVRRGDLVVTVTESGSIRAKDSIQYKCRVERGRGGGEITILSVVPPGTYITQEDVDAGMVLVELDASTMEDQLQREEMELVSAQENYTASKEAYDIQIIQNESAVAAARLKVRFALMDLEKYLGKELAEQMTAKIGQTEDLSSHVAPFLDRVNNEPNLLDGSLAGQDLKKLRDEIVLAEGNLATAEDTLVGTEKLHAAEYVSDLELERDRLSVISREFAYQNSKVNLDLFLSYDFPKNAEQNLSNYIEAGREMERTYAECRSRLAQAQARLSNAQESFTSQRSRVDDYKKQIEHCTIRAIAPGLVIYGEGGSGDMFRSYRRGSYGGSGIIAEGEAVYEGQTIISMPDTAAMVAEVSVHETEVQKVRPGQPAQIVMDAFPDKILQGRVLEVASLPDQQRGWMNPDLKVYETLVSVDGTHDFLKTRMSCRVEILNRRIENALLVPVQVVTNRSGRKVCYVATATGPKERIVQTGEFTDTLVQILDGLEEGEEVLLNPPLFDEMSGQLTADRSDDWQGRSEENTPSSTGQPVSDSNPVSDRFKQMDTNGDGKISLSDEVPEQAKQFLKKLDVNEDGFIDAKEMAPSGSRGGSRSRDQVPRGSGRGSRNRSETTDTPS
ncbi:MAG: HlyD family efflux transporter periplasmic adaptor subunit [Phycisphaerae bacterium]|nr:HlyD family efflux transporter periplasmic adaptor subunit [Phycisphaerae bacterium]